MFTRIDIEGVDRVGKGTLIRYLCEILNYKYILNDRGILSQLVYNDLYNRNYDYSDVIMDNKNTLIVYLTADTDDLKIRSKITNEPEIDFDKHKQLFIEYVNELQNKGIVVREYDTTIYTPFVIACMIKRDLEELNENGII